MLFRKWLNSFTLLKRSTSTHSFWTRSGAPPSVRETREDIAEWKFSSPYHVLFFIDLQKSGKGHQCDFYSKIRDFLLCEKVEKFVHLVTQFGSFYRTEQDLKVSFLSGYIFIQTDKPIYNPGDTVRYRAFVSNVDFKAFNGTISVEIQNPDDITVHASGRIRAQGGIFSNTYGLSDLVKEGKWKITAKFDHWKENTFSSEFEVKKYVLPAFNVTLTPVKHHLDMEDKELVVKVSARYLYGEQVEGVAYVVFGVERNGNKIRLPSMKQVKDLEGGEAILTMEELKRSYPNVKDLVGSSIYVKASVMTSTGSDLVEAEKSGIKIVIASYMLSFRGTPKFFKPGLPFDLTVSPLSFSKSAITMALQLQTFLQQQAKESILVQPHIPSDPSRPNYLYISRGTSEVRVGEVLNLKLTSSSTLCFTHSKTLCSFQIVNKGKIIQAGKVRVAGQDVTNFPLRITSEFQPAFRLLAYYMLPWNWKGEVVAESMLVEVESDCVGSLTVSPIKGQELDTHLPGCSFHFQVRGDPGAKVSLVAVDNAVFLLSKGRLTQSKIWDTVGRSDMGCSVDGIGNSLVMFRDSGLSFRSSIGVDSALKKYSQDLEQRCCMAGMREIPMPYSCHRRSLYITENWSCVIAFLECCSQYWGQELGVITPPPPTTAEPPPTHHFPRTLEEREMVLSQPNLLSPGLPESPRSPVLREGRVGLSAALPGSFVPKHDEDDDDDDDYASVEDIYVRTKFFESWLWTDITLPGAPEPGLSYSLANPIPKKLGHFAPAGICVAEPYNVRAWKHFFIDLRLPRTAARHEHVEVKAVLHNYMNQDLQVLVILEKTSDMCSVAFTGSHKQEVLVRARSSVLLRYTVIPLKAGNFPLQVTATARSFAGQDAIRKTLRVVVSICSTRKTVSVFSRSAHFMNGKQEISVKKAEVLSVVPNSIPETFVNVRGDLLADSIDNSINKDSLAALIRMPGGCVEQNLASITLPLIAAHYLDRSKQWESVGIHRREEAVRYIQQGYENQLYYRKKDDSYPPYRNEGTSTWITAFVVKVFSMAKNFISVDEKYVCGPLIYLLKHKQLSFGAFKEDNPVYTTSMTGGLQGAESKETLTAFVLIALAEAQNAVTCNDPSVVTEVRMCTFYQLENQCQCHIFTLSSPPSDRTHWPDSSSFFTLEATGYALLALLKGGHMQEATAPFKWLNEQRRVGGGYGSTQSTMIVLQALSEYLVKRPPESKLNLHVELRVPGRSDTRWAFTPTLAHVARSSRVVTVYNELPDVYEKSTCNGFELDVSITESSEKPPPDVEKSFHLSIRVRALEPRQVRMAILDISLPTGFEPETSDLEQLTNSVDRYINNFQVVDNLSDRGSLIIHLFKVSNREPDIITFRLQQKFKVGLLQPSTVTVYQYYNKDKHCSKFYTPPEDKEELGQICKDNICRCTQGSFVNISVIFSSPVFKIRVLNVSASQYDRYEVEILQVIKEGDPTGSEVGLKPHDTRVFLSHAGCRAGLNLQKGQDYLIIGPTSDIWSTYILGKKTWVERWPSSAECLTQAAMQRCQDLETFANELLQSGCQT
uniref:Complement component c3b, tandem duplicate 2 n=1 Tax=Pygocentrus nattereri TaxID=42514 RepID=A0A3B4CQV3_PYGNA